MNTKDFLGKEVIDDDANSIGKVNEIDFDAYTRDRLSADGNIKVDELLDRYPALKGFYWAKEKMRELY